MLVFILAAASLIAAETYRISDTFIGPSFLTNFVHEAIPDPTNGRVNYVDAPTAKSQNLTYANGNSLILRADWTKTLAPDGPGRDSVRIKSTKQWTTHVEIIDVRHMPEGCGTWPAYWTVGDNWPSSGELDIIEGVNGQSPNAATLHTAPNCVQPAVRLQTGNATTTDCNSLVNSNTGCGVRSLETTSFGPSFNAGGGGWYAMERTSTFIKVWFWPRNSARVPDSVRNGEDCVNTDEFGLPFALFVNEQCDMQGLVTAHYIVINLTFCGDWGASVYPGSGCPGTCVDYVNSNPAAFKSAYWDIAALRIYE